MKLMRSPGSAAVVAGRGAGVLAMGLVVAAVCVLLAAVQPATALACPNDVYRTGPSAHLPECRAYERVSPQDKQGAAQILEGLASGAGGGAVAYGTTGAFAGDRASLASTHISYRETDGWHTYGINPPTLRRNPDINDQYYANAFSADFESALIDTRYPVDANDQGNTSFHGTVDVFRWTKATDDFAWVSHGANLPETEPMDATFVDASDDLGRVLVSSNRPFVTPETPAGGSGTQLYLATENGLHTVSVPPAGETFASAGAAGSAFQGGLAADGTTVVFLAGNELYVRTHATDPALAATRMVSASKIAAGQGCKDLTPFAPTFMFMTADGRTVFFSCRAALTAGAPSDGGIYAYDVPSGATHFLAQLGGFVAADPQARHLYVATNAVLTPDAVPSISHIYDLVPVHGADGAVVGVTPTLAASWTNTTAGSPISDDGTRLMVTSTMPPSDVGVDSTYDNDNHTEIYLYDATAGADGTLTCISCRPDGSPATGDANLDPVGWQSHGPRLNYLSGDGRHAFFNSDDAVVPQATNGNVNVYEWSNGHVSLISSGRDTHDSAFIGTSRDGADAFFVTAESLVPNDVDNGVKDVYDARVDGGLPAPARPVACDGDACQGAPGSGPGWVPPASMAFHGLASPSATTPKAKRPTRFAVARITRRQRVRLAAGKRIVVRVRVSRAARVRAALRARVGRRGHAHVRRIGHASGRAARAGTVRLRVRLSRAALRQLRRHAVLRVQLRVRVSGASQARNRGVTLRSHGHGAGR